MIRELQVEQVIFKTTMACRLRNLARLMVKRLFHLAPIYAGVHLHLLVARFANALTIDDNGVQWVDKQKTIICKVVLSGNYAQAVRLANTGEVLIPNTAANPQFLPGAVWGLNGPRRAYVINGPAGLGAEMLPGADNFHWLLRLFNPTTGAELAAGPYAALNTADLDFKVAFEGRAID